MGKVKRPRLELPKTPEGFKPPKGKIIVRTSKPTGGKAGLVSVESYTRSMPKRHRIRWHIRKARIIK